MLLEPPAAAGLKVGIVGAQVVRVVTTVDPVYPSRIVDVTIPVSGKTHGTRDAVSGTVTVTASQSRWPDPDINCDQVIDVQQQPIAATFGPTGRTWTGSAGVFSYAGGGPSPSATTCNTLKVVVDVQQGKATASASTFLSVCA